MVTGHDVARKLLKQLLCWASPFKESNEESRTGADFQRGKALRRGVSRFARGITQASTLDQLVTNLKEAIALHLEGENLSDLDLDDNPAVVATFELDDVVSAQA